MIIKKMLFPIIKKKLTLFLTILIICLLGVSFSSAFISAGINMKSESYKYVDFYGLPDITLITHRTFKDKEVENISVPGATINYRKSVNFSFTFNDKVLSSRGFTYTDDSFSKRYVVSETVASTTYPNISFDYKFANNNNIKPGNLIKIHDEYFFVQSLVGNPESISTVSKIFVPQDRYDFGYTYINKIETSKIVSSIYDFKDNNEVIVKVTDKSLSLDYVKAQIENQLKERTIRSILHVYKEDHPAFVYLNSILKDINVTVFVIPAIFALLILIMVLLFMFQFAKSLSREIGILLATGFDYKSILKLLLSFSALIAGIASIIGLVCGHFLNQFIFNMFKNSFGIPYGVSNLNLIVGLITPLVLLVITGIATLSVGLIVKKISPKDVIFQKLGETKNLPEFVNKNTEKISPSKKVAIASLINNKSRTIISIFTVACAFIMCFGSFNLFKSEKAMVGEIYERDNYQGEVFVDVNWQYPLDPFQDFFVDQQKAGLVKQFEFVINAKVNINNSNTYYPLCAIKDSDLHNVVDKNKQKIKFDTPNSIVIDVTQAEELNVKIGDKVKICNCEIPLTITNLSKIATDKKVYMEYDTFKNIIESEKDYDILFCHSIIFNCDNFTKFKDVFLAQPFAKSASLTNNIQHIDSFTSGANLLIMLSIAFVILSLLISLASLIVVTQSSYLEQKRKFSIMRLLGLEMKNISKVLLFQNIFFITVGFIFGIPLGSLFGHLIIKMCSKSNIKLDYLATPLTYLIVILLVIVIMAVNYLVSYLLIKKTNIVENTKSRE